MNKTFLVGLTGHADQFRLEEAAYDRLAAYLDRAEVRLQDDPDRAEVLGDLERSIGDRLAALPADDVVTALEMEAILDRVGAVDTGWDPGTDGTGARPRKRRLVRIREGQEIAGVCTGLAAYTEVRLDWVRWFVVLATIFTGGILGLVYVALVLILPVEQRSEAPR